jgi:hypothetical protein
VLRKFSSSCYEIGLTSNLGTYQIFNVSYLYPFKEKIDNFRDAPDSDNVQTIDWEEKLPIAEEKHIKYILEQKVVRKTIGK